MEETKVIEDGQKRELLTHRYGIMKSVNEKYNDAETDSEMYGDKKRKEFEVIGIPSTPVVVGDSHTHIIRKDNIPKNAYENNPHRQPTPSKFVFFSDKKSVPTDMKKLQEKTIRRRRDFADRMHDLDCHTARLMSKYAEERMDLSLATCDTFERTVIHPLETTVERLAIDREASTSRSVGISALERRVGRIDAQMIHHIHVKMSDEKLEKIDSIHDDLQQNLASEIRIENTKYNKIEGGIVQRFEHVTKNATINFHSEGATRRASIELLRRKVEKTIPERVERAEITLSNIANLRAQIREERAKRQVADKSISDDVMHKTDTLKRAMIAMVSDGDSSR